ncbi:YgcG family protein [Accumulibacter sp.]|uniref:TPM domain-containing protein n=1 Tax=Accumulibacter sp. TaxID=2053492 RepID=UPI00260735FD|nr:YgcG family protein [Accumulibacter sp.]
MTTFFLRLLAWLLAVFLQFGVGFAFGAQLQPIPPLGGRVTDLTGTLAAEQRTMIEAKLAAFERAKGAQVAVLVVPTVQPEAVEQYALRVVEAWKLGRQGVDDGALLLVARDDRKLRIEVGYGLEGALNDATAKRIISETISPRFKQGDFAGGIDAGVDAMLKVIGGEPLPPPRAAASTPTGGQEPFETLLIAGFILVFVVGRVLRAIFGRFLAAAMIAVAAGVIAAMLLSSLLVAALVGLLAFLAALFAGVLGPVVGSSRGGPWGGGGGGSGGFSGGGGRFGGGGASGGW